MKQARFPRAWAHSRPSAAAASQSRSSRWTAALLESIRAASRSDAHISALSRSRAISAKSRATETPRFRAWTASRSRVSRETRMVVVSTGICRQSVAPDKGAMIRILAGVRRYDSEQKQSCPDGKQRVGDRKSEYGPKAGENSQLPPARFPMLAGVLDELADIAGEDQFKFGLAALIVAGRSKAQCKPALAVLQNRPGAQRNSPAAANLPDAPPWPCSKTGPAHPRALAKEQRATLYESLRSVLIRPAAWRGSDLDNPLWIPYGAAGVRGLPIKLHPRDDAAC